MEKKETTPRRVARRSYEERNKDKRKQASGNFGTMIPRDLFDEINALLAKHHITKVQLIFRGYESLKAKYVDYATQERTPKKSAYWYKKVMQTNAEDLSVE